MKDYSLNIYSTLSGQPLSISASIRIYSWGLLYQPFNILYNAFCKAIGEGNGVRAVFCDISKAFDRVWHVSYIKKAWSKVNIMTKRKFKIDRKSLETIYLTLFRPILEYGEYGQTVHNTKKMN